VRFMRGVAGTTRILTIRVHESTCPVEKRLSFSRFFANKLALDWFITLVATQIVFGRSDTLSPKCVRGLYGCFCIVRRKEPHLMKRACWIALVAVFFWSPVAQTQTVDDIIAKNAQARGGLDKLHGINTLRVTARISEDDFRATYIQVNKREDKVREETEFQGMARVRAYDGQTAWQINPFGGRRDPELMSQDDSKPLVVDSDVEGLLIDYKPKGYHAELVGHDSVEGTDCYKIKLTLKDGDVRYYYLDTDSFLEIKIESQTKIRGAVRYRDTMLGDYEQVDGIYFPFAIQKGEAGSEERTTYTVEKIQVNVPLEDSLFSMPATKAAAKPAS
jgi:outer membrane lipoprotein-sorting protein